MANLLGPGAFGAARTTNTRPALTPENGVSTPDDWFRDCSNATTRDGTEVRAGFLNAMLAQFRSLVRAGGVVEDNSDDHQITRAFRSQRPNFFPATAVVQSGTSVSIATGLPFAAIGDLLAVPIRFISEATSAGPMVVSVNGLAVQSLTWPDGTAIAAGDIQAGELVEIMHDGAAFRIAYTISPTQVRGMALQRTRAVFTATGSGSWIVPANITRIITKQWGGGGGGGYSTVGAASGGGSGAYVERFWRVSPGNTVTFSIGAGGAGGAASPAQQGQPGGATTITVNGTTITAGGGQGGLNGSSSNVSANSPAGGTPTGGDINLAGQPGPFGYVTFGPTILGGNGAAAPLGGAGVPGGSGAASNGQAPGGGGSASGNSNFAGGTGARGEVWIEY